MRDVGVGQLVEELEQRGDRLPFEIGAFVALEACEGLLQESVRLEPDDVRVTLEGAVVVSNSATAAEPDEAARSLVSVLARLLVAAGPGVPPYLLQLVKDGVTGASDRDLRQLHDAIEASLIPVNRGASRRVLARLVRESDRPPAPAVPAAPAVPDIDPQELDAELDELLRDPVLRTLEPRRSAPPEPPPAARVEDDEDDPVTERIRVPRGVREDAEAAAAIDSSTEPGLGPAAAAAPAPEPSPIAAHPEPITATIRKWSLDEESEPEASTPQAVEEKPAPEPEPKLDARAEEPPEPATLSESEPKMQSDLEVRADEPVQPEPEARADESVQPELEARADEPVEPEPDERADEPVQPELEARADDPVQPELEARADEPAEPELEARADDPTEPEPDVQADEPIEPAREPNAFEAETPTEVVFSQGSASTAESIPAPEPVVRESRISVERASLPEPLPSRRGGWGVWLLVAVLGLGVYGLVATGALQTLIAPAANPVAGPGSVDVTVSPEGAQVFIYVGRGPSVATELSVGDSHEFVVFQEGLRPARVAVPGGAPWPEVDGRPLYELAVQPQPASSPADAADFGVPFGPTGSSANSARGAVRIVTNPPGAKVYRYLGAGPDVSLGVSSIHEGQEVLVVHPGYETRRAVIGPSDWETIDGKHRASLRVELPGGPSLVVPQALED